VFDLGPRSAILDLVRDHELHSGAYQPFQLESRFRYYSEKAQKYWRHIGLASERIVKALVDAASVKHIDQGHSVFPLSDFAVSDLNALRGDAREHGVISSFRW